MIFPFFFFLLSLDHARARLDGEEFHTVVIKILSRLCCPALNSGSLTCPHRTASPCWVCWKELSQPHQPHQTHHADRQLDSSTINTDYH